MSSWNLFVISGSVLDQGSYSLALESTSIISQNSTKRPIITFSSKPTTTKCSSMLAFAFATAPWSPEVFLFKRKLRSKIEKWFFKKTFQTACKRATIDVNSTYKNRVTDDIEIQVNHMIRIVDERFNMCNSPKVCILASKRATYQGLGSWGNLHKRRESVSPG